MIDSLAAQMWTALWLTIHLLPSTSPVPTNTGTQIAEQLRPLIDQAITVMQVLIPIIAVFRIVYKFAESREGSVLVLIAEVVLIIFVAFAVGSLLKLLVNVSPS